MRKYVAYSRIGMPCEGAILVFANSVKEAKRIVWNTCSEIGDLCDGEYIDLVVEWLKYSDYLDTQATSKEPHVVVSPETCRVCGAWGMPLDENKTCLGCVELMEKGVNNENG